jgi:plasmid stabilization system protein ParE
MKVVITESASDDIADASVFYESQQTGLGEYFETSLLSDIRSLAIFGGIHESRFELYFRALAKRFPYSIYYRVENDTAFVYAVSDDRRDPTWISDRLH